MTWLTEIQNDGYLIIWQSNVGHDCYYDIAKALWKQVLGHFNHYKVAKCLNWPKVPNSRQFQLRQLIVIGEIRSQPPTLISTHMSLLLCVFPVGLVSNLTFSLGFSPYAYPPCPPHLQTQRGNAFLHCVMPHASIPLL